MFRKVVVPLDGSQLAEQVFHNLPSYVSSIDAVVVLVRVIEPEQYAYGLGMNGEVDFLPRYQSSVNAYLEKARERLGKQGYQATTHVALGDPATEILRVATETGADLIAMSTHGRSGISHWALGSVAERVLHHSTQPVLLVRQGTQVKEVGVNRILVPLDGSERAEQALPAAVAIAKNTGAEISLLQMLQTLDPGNARILFESDEEADALYQKWMSTAEEYLEQAAELLHNDGMDVDYSAQLGDAASGIVDAVNEAAIDLVVMSTHGHTGLRLWYYGSVAGKVLRSVSCPLLLVRSTNMAEGSKVVEEDLVVA